MEGGEVEEHLEGAVEEAAGDEDSFVTEVIESEESSPGVASVLERYLNEPVVEADNITAAEPMSLEEIYEGLGNITPVPRIGHLLGEAISSSIPKITSSIPPILRTFELGESSKSKPPPPTSSPPRQHSSPDHPHSEDSSYDQPPPPPGPASTIPLLTPPPVLLASEVYVIVPQGYVHPPPSAPQIFIQSQTTAQAEILNSNNSILAAHSSNMSRMLDAKLTFVHKHLDEIQMTDDSIEMEF